MTLSSHVAAQDSQKGFAAHNARDYATEFKKLMPLAKAGDVIAQYSIGTSYLHGQGVPQDFKEAVKWYQLAAYQGDWFSQNVLGFMYKQGLGVPQDNVMSHMWYNIAAADGSAMSADDRAEISKKMTPAAIEAAQAMARECMSSGYTKCGY